MIVHAQSLAALHVLRSSDIAEGMQCVVRMSSVAAFAAFVSRTTSCRWCKEISWVKIWTSMIHTHMLWVDFSIGKADLMYGLHLNWTSYTCFWERERPVGTPDQTSKTHHHSSQPCLPSPWGSWWVYHWKPEPISTGKKNKKEVVKNSCIEISKARTMYDQELYFHSYS